MSFESKRHQTSTSIRCLLDHHFSLGLLEIYLYLISRICAKFATRDTDAGSSKLDREGKVIRKKYNIRRELVSHGKKTFKLD